MKKVEVLSCEINCFDKKEALLRISEALCSRNKIRVATINNEICNIAYENSGYLDTLKSFEIKIPDSTGVAWAIRRQGQKTDTIKGVDLAQDVCNLADKNNYSIFLLGGDKSVGQRSAAEITKKFHGIKNVSYLDGIEIKPEFSDKIANKINDSGAEIVFVCLGAPKQETWINNNYKSIDASVFIGLGGTLDFLSKKLPRAPLIMRKLGLEWLFRFIIQPSRYKRMFSALVVFPLRVLKEGKH